MLYLEHVFFYSNLHTCPNIRSNSSRRQELLLDLFLYSLQVPIIQETIGFQDLVIKCVNGSRHMKIAIAALQIFPVKFQDL